MLQAFEAVQRLVGLDRDDAHVRVALVEVAAGAHDRARGSEAGHEMGDASGGLLPDLGARGPVVGQGVRGVPVLVGIEVAVRLLRRHLAHPLERAVGAREGVGRDDARAVGAAELLALLAHALGHHQLDRVALGPAHQGQPHRGVARGRVDDRLAGPERAASLALLDQRQRGAVLDRAARVPPLALAPELDVRRDARQGQADQRRAADRVQDRAQYSGRRGRVHVHAVATASRPRLEVARPLEVGRGFDGRRRRRRPRTWDRAAPCTA